MIGKRCDKQNKALPNSTVTKSLVDTVKLRNASWQWLIPEEKYLREMEGLDSGTVRIGYKQHGMCPRTGVEYMAKTSLVGQVRIVLW